MNGKLTGFLFVKGTVGTSGDVNYATCAAQTLDITTEGSTSNYVSLTVNNYSIVYGNPVKHTWGVYTRRSDLSGTTSPSISTRKMTICIVSLGNINSGSYTYLNYKKSTDNTWQVIRRSGGDFTTNQEIGKVTIDVSPGATYQFYCTGTLGSYFKGRVSIPAATTYKVKYATP